MHVDVGGAGAATRVEVVTGAAAVFAHGTALGGVEGDAGNTFVARQGILGVVEEDVGAARSAACVQVTVAIDETVASVARDEVVGAPVVLYASSRGAFARLDVEASDGRAGVARAALFFVEQVDVGAAGAAALVQVLVDVRPALLLQVLYQGVELTLVFVSSDHHVGDEVGGRGRDRRCQHHE